MSTTFFGYLCLPLLRSSRVLTFYNKINFETNVHLEHFIYNDRSRPEFQIFFHYTSNYVRKYVIRVLDCIFATLIIRNALVSSGYFSHAIYLR